jgi:hypothetical protein
VRCGTIVLACALLFSPGGRAAPVDGDNVAHNAELSQVYRFRFKALGAPAGQAVMSISKLKKVGKKHVRSVRLEAKTEGMARRIFQAIGDGTTWVDEHWLPIRMKWDAQFRGKKRLVRARVSADKLKGSYYKEGKEALIIERSLSKRPTDSVAFLIWLSQCPLAKGRVHQRELFDGRRLSLVTATVGEPERILVPVGLRQAYPIEVQVKRKTRTRKFTYWVGVNDRVPYKMRFQVVGLGVVVAELIDSRLSRGLPTALTASLD